MAEKRTSVLGTIVGGANVVGVLLIWVIMALMCSDVVGRNLFNRPVPGVAEMVASAVVLIVFFQLASAIRHDRLTRADFIYAPLQERQPRLARALRVVFDLTGAAVCAGIAYWTIPRFVDAWTGAEFVGNLGIMTFPRWPMPATVIFGSALAAIQFAAKIPGDLFGPLTHEDAADI